MDVDEHRTLDPARLPAAIHRPHHADHAVNLNGRPCDMTAIMAIADDTGRPVLEDAAQAVGAAWAGRPIGSSGGIGPYSRYPLPTRRTAGPTDRLAAQYTESVRYRHRSWPMW
ncbi:DegT/DnrJ/EryC1/StrS family aminotransferase [Krasilnikovia sp. M28-CT-15]|uniref:DegT/DnrJ/EryC1/StrS family aminotransferase n=1 Tax=Krasilnikovia sp. M28-CT-15 TaxID=3373540 RepID=UPI00399C7F86